MKAGQAQVVRWIAQKKFKGLHHTKSRVRALVADFLNTPDGVEYDCHMNIAQYRILWIGAVILASGAVIQLSRALRMSWLTVLNGGGGLRLKKIHGSR